MDMINPTSITTVKCNSFTLKVASLSDVNYWGVSYLCISLKTTHLFEVECDVKYRTTSMYVEVSNSETNNRAVTSRPKS